MSAGAAGNPTGGLKTPLPGKKRPPDHQQGSLARSPRRGDTQQSFSIFFHSFSFVSLIDKARDSFDAINVRAYIYLRLQAVLATGLHKGMAENDRLWEEP